MTGAEGPARPGPIGIGSTLDDPVGTSDARTGAVRDRRGGQWPEWLHDLQVQRLDAATKAADLAIDTSGLRAQAVVDRVVAYLENPQTV